MSIEPGALVELRRSAALAHALPGMAVSLRDGERLLVTVSRDPDRSRRHLSPCQYRCAVAWALNEQRAGRSVGIAGCTGPAAIDCAVAAPASILAGGVVRSRVGPRVVWATTATLAADEVVAALEDADLTCGRELTVRVLWDDLVEVSVVHFELDHSDPAVPGTGDRIAMDLLAACSVAELLVGLDEVRS